MVDKIPASMSSEATFEKTLTQIHQLALEENTENLAKMIQDLHEVAEIITHQRDRIHETRQLIDKYQRWKFSKQSKTIERSWQPTTDYGP